MNDALSALQQSAGSMPVEEPVSDSQGTAVVEPPAAPPEPPVPPQRFELSEEETLQFEVENQPIRYQMDVGRLCWVPRGTRVVEVMGGGFAEIENPSRSIERAGLRRESPYTEYLDPKNPVHKQMIDELESLIEKYPSIVNKPVCLKREVHPNAGRPWPTFDTMDGRSLATYADKGGWDLAKCLEYELSKKDGTVVDAQTGEPLYPRNDVIKALEEIHAIRVAEAADSVDEVVEL